MAALCTRGADKRFGEANRDVGFEPGVTLMELRIFRGHSAGLSCRAGPEQMPGGPRHAAAQLKRDSPSPENAAPQQVVRRSYYQE